jgi:hypothetical protein
MTKKLRYLPQTISSLFKYYNCIFIYFICNTSLSAQCIDLTWVDANLESHSGPPYISWFPEPAFDYLNENYKTHQVSKVTEFSDTFKIREAEYDRNGLLITRWQIGSGASKYFTHNFHNYSYSRDYRVVTDTIQHVVMYWVNDSINKKYIKKIEDTLDHVQQTFYNTKNKIHCQYNKLLFDDKTVSECGECVGFSPDSLFYYYDSCGVRDSIVWFGGDRRSIYFEYREQDKSVLISGYSDVEGYRSWLGNITWSVNPTGNFTGLDYEKRSILLHYRKNKIVKREEMVPSAWHLNHKDIKITTHYKYFRKRLNKVVIRSIDTNGKKSSKSISMKRYKNGLPKNSLYGSTLQYSYR